MSAEIPFTDPHRQPPDDSRCKRLEHVFKPFFISLQVAGLYYPADYTQDGKLRWSVKRVYCTMNICLLWLGFVRILTIYDVSKETFNVTLFFKIVISTWSLVCAIQATSLYRGCSEVFPKFGRLWNELEKSEDANFHIKLKKKIAIYMIVGWLLVIFNIIFCLLVTFNTHLMDITFLPLTPDSEYYTTYQIILSAVTVWQSAAWVLPVVVSVVFAKYFINKYEMLAKMMKNNTADGKMEASELKGYRRQHEKITELVQCADDGMNACAAGVIVCNMAIICLIMYIIIWSSNVATNALNMATNLFWILTATACLCTFIVGGHHINIQVRLHAEPYTVVVNLHVNVNFKIHVSSHNWIVGIFFKIYKSNQTI